MQHFIISPLFSPNILTSSQLACQLQLVERCTGIARVMDFNPLRARIFFRSYFQLLFQQCSQLRESLKFVSSPQCKYMNFIYLKSLSITWMVYLNLTYSPAPSWLASSVGRALHRYRRGDGFKSPKSPNFLQVLFSTTSSVVFLTAKIS